MTCEVYVVTKGRRRGIYLTEEEFKDQVYRYPGAEYTVFQTLDEAESYFKEFVTALLTTESQAAEEKYRQDNSYICTRKRYMNNKLIRSVRKKKRQARN